MTNDWQGVIGNGAGGIDAAYDPANKAIGVVEQNPQPIQLPETVVEATNVAAGTYEYYIDVESYRTGEMQIEIGAATATVTVTLAKSDQNDGTAAALATYQDVSQYGVGIHTAAATLASYIADAILKYDIAGAKFLRVTVVVAGANDGDFDIYNGLST
jgi:glucose/arabinose dehydrogenase